MEFLNIKQNSKQFLPDATPTQQKRNQKLNLLHHTFSHVLSQFHNLSLTSKKLVFLSVILMTTVSIKEKIVNKI